MKNTITLLFLIFTFSNFAYAQSEPEAIKTKDLIDKLDRSEISTDESNPTLENIFPDFEMPKIEFNDDVDKSTKPKKNQTKKTKKVVNKLPKSNENKNNVVFAKRPITLVQLMKNDKIVLSNSQTYVYRLSNKTITQYKIKDKVPLKSLGLKISGKNSFYIVDIALLKKDAKAIKNKSKPKIKKSRKPKSKTVKVSKHKSKTVEISKPQKAEINNLISPEIAAKRKSLEKKLNHGKSINKTITLRALQTNDEIIISGNVQLVIRKKKSTSGMKKYWLTEKLDTNNASVVKKSKNLYKLIKSYQ